MTCPKCGEIGRCRKGYDAAYMGLVHENWKGHKVTIKKEYLGHDLSKSALTGGKWR